MILILDKRIHWKVNINKKTNTNFPLFLILLNYYLILLNYLIITNSNMLLHGIINKE